MERSQVFIGTGGWEHDVLDQCLYPQSGMTSNQKLAYYARFFGTTEVRATFWDESIAAADARGWAEAVEGRHDFLFNVKLHKAFTHKRELHSSMAKNIRGVLQELARHNKLGALLLQFPYGFTNTGAGRQHLVKLAELFRGFPLHVELRHESWQSSGLMSFLEEHGLHPVSVDLPKIRQYIPYLTGVVGDTAYLRLHGRNEKGWLLNGIDARYDYLYNSREISEIRRRIEALAGRCRRIMLICNNTTGGKAVANALQLSHALNGKTSHAIPRSAFRVFPSLQEIGVPEDDQQRLFDAPGLRSVI